MTGYSFLVLIKKSHELCFEKSSCKLLSFKNSKNSSWAYKWQVCGLLYFNCVGLWFADPTFPESNSTVLLKLCIYKVFDFDLKLPSVISKQLVSP